MNRPSAAPAPAATTSAAAHRAAAEIDPVLEDTLTAVESRLSGLADALRQRDLGAIDEQAAELHRALARAVDQFSRASRSGTIPLALRRRLAQTGGRVAAQRESFARATAALDRAIDVLLPRPAPAVYGATGTAQRGSLGGSIQA